MSRRMVLAFLFVMNLVFLNGCTEDAHILATTEYSSHRQSSELQSEEIETEAFLEDDHNEDKVFDGNVSGYDFQFSGSPYEVVNDNVPFFTEEEKVVTVFEKYAPFDQLGRCGVAYANICVESMPTEPRGEIGNVKPSGWHTVKYNDRIEGNYLYNRCHLIAFELAGENANENNLITGTRYMNVTGMLPFENRVADYVKTTQNHVLYRVTPVFEGEHLLADGVLMEAYSVEDSGKGIQFCVFVFNVQPGIGIDYATGDSWVAGEDSQTLEDFVSMGETLTTEKFTEESGLGDTLPDSRAQMAEYILNTNTHKFHSPDCKSVSSMKEKNKQAFYGTRDELIEKGYMPCGNCKP